jgi:CMP/dCMP kinase
MSMSSKTYNCVLAIDGPSGSGKSTIAKLVAKNLNILYIDTGAMFRAFAYILSQKDLIIDGPSDSEVQKIKAELAVMDFNYGVSEQELIVINGENLTQIIREHHVSTLASQVSKIQIVRDYLKDKQREIVGQNHSVMEGRDIGTVIFPNAYCKIFLTASDEVRAQRRFSELQAKGDTKTDLATVLIDLKKRDESDIQRANAPLKKADDAQLVDTSDLTIQEVVENIVSISKSRESCL